MFKNNKHVFWEAFLISVFILVVGILLGVTFEDWRAREISDMFQQSELDLLDIRVQNEIFSFSEIDCEKVIQENIKFADRIYWEAVLLRKYDESSELSDSIVQQHRKYDLLRALLWVNSIKIKSKCKASYHNIVYIYDYLDVSLDARAKQAAFSKILGELKQKRGEDVLLIPMAGDNNLVSISLLMDVYDIQEQELPVIIIDEKTKIRDIKTVEEIEKLL